MSEADEKEGGRTIRHLSQAVMEPETTRFKLFSKGTGDVPEDELLGEGVELPSGLCVVEWRREAYPEENQLDHVHISQYGSLDDVEQAIGSQIVMWD